MASRDTVEFQQLFEPLYRQCHALGRRLLNDERRAEAAATEAMARTYAKWSRVRALPHPEGWALRMTGQLATDGLRADSRGASELGLAIAELAPQVRDAVILRFLTPLEEDEVGLVLGMRPESVRAAVNEGLAVLRNRFGGGAGVSAA